jgi:hypothetical protein
MNRYFTTKSFFVVFFSTCLFASQPKYSVEMLPEYDGLFTKTEGWTGADGAYSLPLTDKVTLWLFGDTWIGKVADGKHTGATMINNSIALQTGKNPATALVKFFPQATQQDKPAAFFEPEDGNGFFWISHGIVTDGKLYVFLMHIIKTGEEGVFGFKQIGTSLAEIDNPNDDPLEWRIHQHKVPYGRYSKDGNLFFGSAVMKDGDFVYVYGADEDWSKVVDGRSMIVARVPADNIADFKQWRFFRDGQWQADLTGVAGLFAGTATEYSVCYQPSIRKYIAVYTEIGLSKNIMMRLSPTPTGPWSDAYRIFECPEVKWHKTYFCYAAKAHPEISVKDELIVTYACNSTDFWQMAADARIYRPRFLKIKFDVQTK